MVNFRNCFLEFRPYRLRNISVLLNTPVIMKICIDPVYVICIFVEPVIADLMLNPQQDQNAARHPNR